MLKLKTSYIRMDSAVVLLLFTLFTAAAVSVVLTVSRQYQYVADAGRMHFENRTAAAYLREKLHQNDREGAADVAYIEGIEALHIESVIEGNKYQTYIYYKNGWLYELLAAENAFCSLDAGQPVIELNDFKLQSVSPQLLKVSYTDLSGQKQFVYINTLAVGEND